MTKSITIALSLFFMTALGAMAQCAYTITGQVTSNNQVVNNQAVVITSNAGGLDTVFTNPNGVYLYNLYNICDSSMTFTVQAAGCGIMNNVTVSVNLNQTVNVPITLCNSASSCTTSVQVTTNGNTAQYSWAGSALGGATVQTVMWDYGDGSVSNNYPNGGSHIYPNPGVYQLCATVTWSNGCTSTDCESVSIGVNTLDSCEVVVNTNVSGNTVSYSWTGTSSDGSAVQSITWYTNNGIALGSSPTGGSYTFNSPGAYTICASVTWAGGCSDIGCSNVTIGGNTQQNICGCVTYVDANNDTMMAGCGTAYLIQFDSSSNAVIVIDSTNITPNGYCFYGNYAGNYTVWAQPCAALSVAQGVLPTYLGNVLDWQSAANASYGFNNYAANCIVLSGGQNLQGPAQIGGTILWGDDKAPGDPVADITVFLFDNNGDVITSTITDLEGYYSFDDLPYGTYQIYPELPGTVTYPTYVTVSPENPSVEADNFYLGFGMFATAGVEESVINIGGLYPNPAQDVAVLSLTSKEAGLGKLNITDITGKTVQSSSVSIAQGQQNISLDLQDITAGVYTVTLTLHGQQMHTKLIKR